MIGASRAVIIGLLLGGAALMATPEAGAQAGRGLLGTPHRVQGTAELTGGATFVEGSLPAVPAGQTFVVEYVSMAGTLPAGQEPSAQLRLGATELLAAMPLAPRAGLASGADRYVASLPIRLYLDAGAVPLLHFVRSAGGGPASAEIVLSGDLVEVP